MNNLGVRIPGKVIITGEHSVVYGKLALAASLNLGVKVWVEKGERGDIHILENDNKGLVRKAIEVAGGDETIRIKIESELPVGSGLGSSAAVAAGVIKGVREYLEKPITSEELFELTMEVEKVAHGNPSGVDPATVVYGGLIGYIKGQRIERLRVLKPFKVLLVNSGKPSESTKEMVELVAINTKKEQIIKEIGEVSRKIRDKLVGGDEIFELINENGLLLEQLGVVGERARELSEELRKEGSFVKITGAGGVETGSGMMMVVAKDLEKTKRLLDNGQAQYFETVIGER
ncbi:MAG: mevalonate kinase [bacterium]